MKTPELITSVTGWITCSIIMSFITGITTRFFTKQNQVDEKTCKERREVVDKLANSRYDTVDKKLDYLIKRIDDHFDIQRNR